VTRSPAAPEPHALEREVQQALAMASALDPKLLRALQRRILLWLRARVDDEELLSGFDPTHDGLAEQEIARQLGERYSTAFQLACDELEHRGWVLRSVGEMRPRHVMRIWPTAAGLRRADELALPWWKKAARRIGTRPR
jgi:hypothetical protein